ncbi:MAG TPA: C45 family peptidase [Ramlibacter sp.]|nr:C45 family peptidase [Ramlibacter sp.]
MNNSACIFAVAGSPYDRGIAQGRAFRDAIARHGESLLAVWRNQGIDDPIAYRAQLLRETRFEDAIERHAPHLLREVEGIADGSGLSREEVYALQLLDEEWAFRRRLKDGPPLHKCSSVAVRNEAAGVTWIGQNMDLGAYTDGLQRLVQHAPCDGRPGAMIVTIAGVLGLLGVNDAGVGLCVNSIPQVPSAAEGVPVAFVVRRLLEARTAAEAGDWCRRLPHATNQHYLIADGSLIVSLEASSDGVVDVPLRTPDRSLHTNHPIASGARYPEGEENSVARLRSLDQRLGQGTPLLEDLRGALTSFDDERHPVCRLRSDELGPMSFTTASMISALHRNAAAVEGWVSFGPPSQRGYEIFTLNVA